MATALNGHDSALLQNPATADTASEGQQTDPLTGLPTQVFLNRALDKLLKLSQRQSVTATLALLQLANFYEIRTWVGRAEADLLLSDIARVLQKALPESATLCRCDHYEFALLLENECSLNARLVTDRVKMALQSAASSTIPPQLELRCAVGLADISQHIPGANVMFARARHNLSQATYRPDPDRQESTAPVAPARAIRQIQAGLRAGGLSLNYQPILCLREDGLEHYEVRARLHRDENAMSGSQLFALAVQNALGETLDHLIIGRALDLLRKQRRGKLRLTVNLSLNSLVSNEFLSWLSSQLQAEPDLAGQLLLQLSEIDILIAQHYVGSFSEGLNELGVRLGINHFGCAEEPLRYLPLLRADFVKLDVSLVEKIATEPQRYREFEALVARLQGQGLRVVVGLVEDLALLPLLWQAGVNFVQGHCLQTPSDRLYFQFLRRRVIQ